MSDAARRLSAAPQHVKNEMASINQAPQTQMDKRLPASEAGTRQPGEAAKLAVPDFRNIGSVLRIVAVGNVLVLVTALIRMQHWGGLLHDWLLLAGAAQVPLLLAALTMYLLGSWLPRLTWRELSVISVCVAVLAAVLAQGMGLLPGPAGQHFRQILWAGGAALLLVGYFRWRQIEQTPALDEARILALTARIRPHFFFNSLNGVLGVIRSDPRRAEQALESLAELFRELMKDNRELVTLCDEIDLCNRYLDLERLRLGDRLKVNLGAQVRAAQRQGAAADAATAHRKCRVPRHRTQRRAGYHSHRYRAQGACAGDRHQQSGDNQRTQISWQQNGAGQHP
ncbi:MAG: histidine kinase [Rhodocyclaceae bacterium]